MRVTVLLGGVSAEREVSLASGRAVAEALRRAGHTVRELDANPHNVPALRPGEQDVVFIALHGSFGEDGTVQDILDRAGIPYVGSAGEASRLAMNKPAAKAVFREVGVFTPDWTVLRADEAEGSPPGADLGLPVVVKPASQGSSIGVNIVCQPEEWVGALREALRHDSTLLIERYVRGRELTVGILADRALPIIELRPRRRFYDYQAKYEGEQTAYLFDIDLPRRVLEAVSSMAQRAYWALGCRDLARVDLIVDDWHRPFVLEVNTIPGFTDHSLVPKAARRAGISFEELCDRLVWMAWRRGVGVRHRTA